jgi:hypothetical protein
MEKNRLTQVPLEMFTLTRINNFNLNLRDEEDKYNIAWGIK